MAVCFSSLPQEIPNTALILRSSCSGLKRRTTPISSSSAKAQGNIKNGPYGASKAAVNSLTQTLALELGPGIRVNAVAPGPIPTKNFNESTNFPADQPLEKLLRVPLGRMGEPDDIGHAVVFMASPASSWITGQCLYVTGGL